MNLPEIKALNDQFKNDAQAVRDFLEKDEAFKQASDKSNELKKTDKAKAGHLWRKAYAEAIAKYKDDSEYVKLYDQWETSKVEYYIGVFERIIDDYEKQGTPFPMAWIENNGYPPESGTYPRERKKYSYQEAREQVIQYEKLSEIPPIRFNPEEVFQYWSEVPELKELREQCVADRKTVLEILKEDDQYRKAHEKYEANRNIDHETARKERSDAERETIRRLQDNVELTSARKKYQEDLLICNITTLRYIIDEYEREGKPLPTDLMKRQPNSSCVATYK
jgi:hypothetical protein